MRRLADNTPLHYAAALSRPKFVAWLIELGSDLHATNEDNEEPADSAVAAKGVKGEEVREIIAAALAAE